jgi:hypothetical protein
MTPPAVSATPAGAPAAGAPANAAVYASSVSFFAVAGAVAAAVMF